ncbi:Putative zinc transporter msc2 [Rhodotorula sphaerocarpa]
MSKAGYAEAFDPRVSGRVSLAHFDRSRSTQLPADLLLALGGSKLALAFALHASREWLFLRARYSPWTATAAVLVVGALPLSFTLFLETLFTFLAVTDLGATKFLLFASFSSLWARGFPLSALGGRKAADRSNAFVLTTALVLGGYLLDSTLSAAGPPRRRGYLFLLLHLWSVGQRVEILAGFPDDERERGRFQAIGVLYAAAWACAAAVVRKMVSSPLPLVADVEPLSTPAAVTVLVLVAVALLVVDPLLTRSLVSHFPPAKLIRPGWPVAILAATAVGRLGFVVGYIVSTDPRAPVVAASSVTTGSSAQDTGFLAQCESFYRHTRATIKIILASPESRRIYFFLCLNLAFMFVQMAYGVWTNSLGLISDSIHMFFDCLALGMGLFASVMATWPSNAVFTYGYSRVETLSGFANGVFLCLISIFIVFEAIQRLVDPPEINTGQLLTVSAVGLAVNLVGMLATGGHHGHSHGGGGGGHSHGHSHGHSQTPVRSNSTPFLTMSEPDEHSHGNGHHRAASPSSPTHYRSRSYAGSPLLSPTPQSRHARTASLASPSTPPPPSPHGHSHSSANGHHSHEEQHHHSHGHGHGHGHGEEGSDDEDDVGEEGGEGGHGGHSHNMKGVFLHVLADTLGSVGVIISTLLIDRFGWTGFDPLASIFIAVMIFVSVVPLISDSARILILDMGPEREDELRKALLEVSRLQGVASFTRPRFWLLDSSTMVGSLCIQLAPASSSHDSFGQPSQHYADFEKTKARVRKTLKRHVAGLEYLTIQVEPTGGPAQALEEAAPGAGG